MYRILCLCAAVSPLLIACSSGGNDNERRGGAGCGGVAIESSFTESSGGALGPTRGGSASTGEYDSTNSSRIDARHFQGGAGGVACSSGSNDQDIYGVAGGSGGNVDTTSTSGGLTERGGGGSQTSASAGCAGMAGDLVDVRAAFQRAIDAQPETDGTYKSEVIRWIAPKAPVTGCFGIAVIDSGAYISSSTIYRDRVLGHYTLVGDHFEAIEPEISLPSPAATLMSDTLAANPAYASSVDTADLAIQFAVKYSKLFPAEYSRTHGDLTFNALAELNPSACFLLFHLDGAFHNDSDGDVRPSYEKLACSLREPEGPAKLHTFFRTLGKSIANIIGESRANGVDIRFVSLSAGMDPIDSQNLTRKVCPELQFTIDELTEIQRADAEFLEQIAASDAVLVQSALYASSEITDANWQQWYSDCVPIANRVRVGYALGTRDMLATERVDLQMHNGLRCIDLLIGMGWVDPETPTDSAFKLSSYGTGHGKGAFWGTSIAAPLGLSVLAQYWQEGHKQYDSQSLAAAFRADSNGTPPIRDILEEHLFLNSRKDYVNNLQGR